MSEKKRDILLHPIRMRIFLEVTGGSTTAKSLAKALPDVPQATLYRQLKNLTEAGFLVVVDENPVRGTVERVYGIGTSGLSPEELRGMDAAELRQAVHLVLSGFLGDVERYLEAREGGPIDPIAEGFEFTKSQVHLTEEEFNQLKGDLWAVLKPVTKYGKSANRRSRTFSYLFIPLE